MGIKETTENYLDKEYILIGEEEPIIDVFFRGKNNYWKIQSHIGLNTDVYINSIDSYIPVSEIYINII